MKLLTIQEMRHVAKERGGLCLSKKYINAITKLKWRCQKGHIWEATPNSIKNGSWCPFCAIIRIAEERKFTIQDMWKIAQKRGGRCLSKKYVSNISNLKWRCSKGHIWEAVPKVIKRGGWCPMCLPYISEKICREIFQKIFGKRFVKIHPAWLVNKNGSRMELDGFCQKLKLAFEYQGKQHYEKVELFAENDTIKIKKVDNLKRRLCKREGVKLIIIPYTVKRTKLYDFIIKKLKKNKIIIPKHQKISIQDLDIYSSQRLLEEMKEIAKKRGGDCLSKFFIDGKTKLKWQCAKNHVWEAMSDAIKRGTWCPVCAGNIKLGIQEMRNVAKERGGKCLSKRYANNQTKLKWQCKKGHVWKAVPASVKNGTWCPVCANIKGHEKLKSDIQEMRRIAENRGGKCLSKRYINSQAHLEWQCSKGHVWKAIPNNVKRDRWCPFCAGHIKLGIQEMRNVAKERGGLLLSKRYINSQRKLKWKCNQGHIWKAVYGNIQQGSWCPVCAQIKRREKLKSNIQEVRKIAENRGGKCLSKWYTNNRTHLEWQCAKGHVWKAVYGNIQQGSWCPVCAGNIKLGIQEMRHVAKEHGGKCLSKRYANNQTKLKWQCNQGHIWKAVPASVKAGTWCPVCAKTGRCYRPNQKLERMK